MDVDKIVLSDNANLFIKEYNDVFHGFDKFPGEYKFI